MCINACLSKVWSQASVCNVCGKYASVMRAYILDRDYSSTFKMESTHTGYKVHSYTEQWQPSMSIQPHNSAMYL